MKSFLLQRAICRTFQKPRFCVEKKRQLQCRPADIQRGRVLGVDALGFEPGSVVLQVQRETAPIAKYFDLIIASRARAAVLLVFVALCALLPGFTAIPPVDRDEPRYAQASKQMMETGNYLDIRFQEQPRYLQPAGIYWLQVTAAKITGYGPEAPIWVYRLPSLLAATAAVVLTYWVALPLAGPVGAFIAALLLTPCILLGVEARLAKTDAVLLASILSATGFLARAYLRQIITLRAAVLFWTACGAGILVKGPMIVLVVGSTVVALCVLDRSTAWLKALRPALGLGWLALLVLPWFIAIAIVSDGEFYRIAIGQSLLGKVAAGQQGHGAPPGVYFLLYWYYVLASGRTCADGISMGLAQSRRACGPLLSGVDPSDVACVRAHQHQAAALCLAGLSCHRNIDCARITARPAPRPDH